MKRRLDLALIATAILVGVVQLLFTIVVDPHARCSVTRDIEAALAEQGLPAQERCLTDATAYHLLGKELAQSNRYERPFDRILFDAHRPTAEYPPLFPFTLSLLDRAGADSIAGQQAVIGTLTAMLTALGAGLLARALGAGRALSSSAMLVVGLHPLLLQAHALLMTEGMFAALAGFVVLLARRTAQRPNLSTAAGLGLLLGAAALARGEGLLWTPIVALFVAAAIHNPTGLARRVSIGLTIIAVAVATMLPWTLRNAARFDALVPVSNNLGTVLDGANCDLTYRGPTIGAWRSTFVPGSQDRTTDCFEGFRVEDPNFSEAAATDRARRDGLHYARTHLARTPLVAAARLGRSFGLFNTGQQVDLEVLEGREREWQWLGTALWWLMLPLAVGGLLVQFRREGRRALTLAIPWVAVIVTTVVTYGNQRFRIGLDAAAVVLAVSAVGQVVHDRSGRRRAAVPPAS